MAQFVISCFILKFCFSFPPFVWFPASFPRSLVSGKWICSCLNICYLFSSVSSCISSLPICVLFSFCFWYFCTSDVLHLGPHRFTSSLLRPLFIFVVSWRPLVAIILITAAKEEVRWHRTAESSTCDVSANHTHVWGRWRRWMYSGTRGDISNKGHCKWSETCRIVITTPVTLACAWEPASAFLYYCCF